MKFKIAILLSLFIITLPIFARRIKTESLLNIQLKDGSNLKGKKISETKDTLYITNRHLGKVAVPLKSIKFVGDNLNNGKMIAIVPFFNGDNDKAFSSTPTFKVSFSSLFDERFSPAIDILYRNQKFDYQTIKYLETTSMDTFGVFYGKYTYKTHFVMPTFTLRFSPLPSSALKSITQNHVIYPYLGMGIGYGIGFATYELKSSEFDFEKKTHNYFGMIYQGIVGVSVRISSRTAFIFETMYEKATFNQKLYNKEKNFDFERDEFSIDGMKLLIGIRFGMF
jgi:hypothetical protein